MEWPQELLEIFDDPLLADVRPKPKPMTADDRIVATLNEITKWCESNGREPSKDGGINEKILWKKLATLREKYSESLAAYDTLKLLNKSD